MNPVVRDQLAVEALLCRLVSKVLPEIMVRILDVRQANCSEVCFETNDDPYRDGKVSLEYHNRNERLVVYTLSEDGGLLVRGHLQELLDFLAAKFPTVKRKDLPAQKDSCNLAYYFGGVTVGSVHFLVGDLE